MRFDMTLMKTEKEPPTRKKPPKYSHAPFLYPQWLNGSNQGDGERKGDLKEWGCWSILTWSMEVSSKAYKAAISKVDSD
jgi:hypothetical protein